MKGETRAEKRSFITRMKKMTWILSGLLFSVLLSAEEIGNDFLPLAVGETDFLALSGQSPFTRALNLSDSLILTGIAMVEDEQVATLINKETNESFVVSSQLNSQGWKMVELQSDGDLEKVAAKVAVDGGEVVTVRYAEWQLKPGESKPGAGNAEGGQIRGDGKGKGKGEGGRRGPPPEMREKMQQLSEEQRNQLFTRMREFREKNPDVAPDQMRQMMSGALDRMLQQQR